MEDELIEDDGISIAELLKLIWKRKFLVLITTIIFVLVFILSVTLFINPSKRYYTTSFDLKTAAIVVDEDDDKVRMDTYPSGKTFNYKNIISLDNISTVLNSKDLYSKLDADYLYNTISITQHNATYYTITINSAKKGNIYVYNSFIEDLLNIEKNNIANDINSIDCDSQFNNYDDYNMYSILAQSLEENLITLIGYYDMLIEKYSNNYIINGRTLQSYKNEVEVYYYSNVLSALKGEAITNHYVKNVDLYNDTRLNLVAGIQNDFDETSNALNGLLDLYENRLTSTGIYGEPFNELIQNITELKIKCIEIKNYALMAYDYDVETKAFVYSGSYVENDDFDNRFLNNYNIVKDFYSDYEENLKGIYNEQTIVSFSLNSVISEQGTISLYIVAILGLVCGVCVGSVIALILEVPSYNEEKKKTNK
ncbi:MAG: hypothetical protein MR357_06240 [Anaeroplasma sp.]|nr:hypothetical protein [Anaeroplasma sp.]